MERRLRTAQEMRTILPHWAVAELVNLGISVAHPGLTEDTVGPLTYYEYCPGNGLRYEFILSRLPDADEPGVPFPDRSRIPARLGSATGAHLVTYVRRGHTWPSYPLGGCPLPEEGEVPVNVCHETYVCEKLFDSTRPGDELHVVTSFLNAVFRCYSPTYALEHFNKIRKSSF